eukprot:GHVU01123057.1.p1 GENE.GHVU01123057.1~~GHVU01123057.1.p1  ORF type:complete len:330 (-),score=40.57 GHVU01123057.1:320-1309(-)
MAEACEGSQWTPNSCDMDAIKKQLEEVGVVVIPDVLTKELSEDCISEYKQWLGKFQKGEPENINSIIHQYGCAHMNATWRVRLAIKHVFATLWGTDKLLTSFDGIAISKPPEEGKAKKFHKADGPRSLHLDQGPLRLGLHAYQGAAYLEAADEDDWCFQVLTGSHKYFEEFNDALPTKLPTEFRKLTDAEVQWFFDKGCENMRVPVPKGGVLIWDARLVHDGAKPIRGRNHPDRWRFVNFISMTPAIWADEEDYEVKKVAMATIRPTRHWSSKGSSMFREYPKYPGLDLEEMPEITKTDDVRYLAGLMKYDFNDGTSNGPEWVPKWNQG